MADYGLLLPFDVDSPEFSRGFEAGRVWATLQMALCFDEFDVEPIAVHASNAEMMLRIAEACGLHVTSVGLDDTWIEVTFKAADDA